MLSGRRHGSKAGSGTVEKAWLGKDDAAWGDAVESWKWLEIGDEEWEKSGLCPRCEHGMKVEQSGAWVGLPAGAGGAEGVRADDHRDFYARCNCGEEHPGRPPEITRGCGRWSLISPAFRK